ncbi:MAG: hypothetical protein L0H41_04980 [Microlunatus sp.]|nr:hypothetical protein [Microlunatus sp.]
MSVVGAAVVLGVLVLLLVKLKAVRLPSALVCILFGLVLGLTSVGAMANRGLTSVGQWMSTQLGGL